MQNQNQKNVHWFPGHMKKALDEISQRLPLVDLVVEIVDARAPLSSQNKYLKEILGEKKRVVVMSKKDLAGNDIHQWLEYFKKEGIQAFCVNMNEKKEVDRVRKYLEEIETTKSGKYERFGLKKPPLRALIVGIPNVGKSTFINKIAKTSSASVRNTPGHTRAQQWVKVSDKFELLDTPGVLPPNFEDKETPIKLALIGTIKADILPLEELATFLANFLISNHMLPLLKAYDLQETPTTSYDLLALIAKRRNYILPKGELDINRTVSAFLNDFKEGRILKVSLDRGQQ